MGKKTPEKNQTWPWKKIRKPFRSFGCPGEGWWHQRVNQKSHHKNHENPVIFATWPTGKKLVGGDWNHGILNDFPYFFWEWNNHPNWRTHIFQRGWNHQPDSEGYEPGQITVDLNPSSAGQPLARPNTCLGIRWQRWWIRPVAVADEKNVGTLQTCCTCSQFYMFNHNTYI